MNTLRNKMLMGYAPEGGTTFHLYLLRYPSQYYNLQHHADATWRVEIDPEDYEVDYPLPVGRGICEHYIYT